MLPFASLTGSTRQSLGRAELGGQPLRERLVVLAIHGVEFQICQSSSSSDHSDGSIGEAVRAPSDGFLYKSPSLFQVVDAKSDVNGNAGNQQNGKTRAMSNGLPSTNRYEVRAGGSADVIDDNLVLSSSPKIHQTTAGVYHTDGGPTGRSNHSSQQTNKVSTKKKHRTTVVSLS